jgi:hypothetical protein
MTTLRNALHLILLAILSQATGVALASFTGTYESGSILVDWETTSEEDILFFNLERSLQSNSGFEILFEYIPAAGDSGMGWFYSVVDDEISEGSTYYYRLVAIDIDEVETYYGPISVYAGANPNPATLTPTPSVTVPNPTSTSTLVQSNTPTNTLESLATSAPTQTPEPTLPDMTLTPVTSPDSIPTLEYTLELTSTDIPTDTPTDSSVSSALPSSTSTVDQTEVSQKPIQINFLVRFALISVVVGIWAVLAIGGYLYIRKHYP